MILTDVTRIRQGGKWVLQLQFGNTFEAVELYRDATPEFVASRLRAMADRVERLEPPTLFEGWACLPGRNIWHYFTLDRNLSACGQHDRDNMILFDMSYADRPTVHCCERCEATRAR